MAKSIALQVAFRVAVFVGALASAVWTVVAILEGLPPVSPDAARWIMWVAAT